MVCLASIHDAWRSIFDTPLQNISNVICMQHAERQNSGLDSMRTYTTWSIRMYVYPMRCVKFHRFPFNWWMTYCTIVNVRCYSSPFTGDPANISVNAFNWFGPSSVVTNIHSSTFFCRSFRLIINFHATKASAAYFLSSRFAFRLCVRFLRSDRKWYSRNQVIVCNAANSCSFVRTKKLKYILRLIFFHSLCSFILWDMTVFTIRHEIMKFIAKLAEMEKKWKLQTSAFFNWFGKHLHAERYTTVDSILLRSDEWKHSIGYHQLICSSFE